MRVLFTLKASNKKTGPMPVSTTSNDTCPDSCALKTKVDDPLSGGCYGEQGNLGMLWRNLSTSTGTTIVNGRATITTYNWSGFCNAISKLPANTLWRHNQAGDLPGIGDKIDTEALRSLVEANADKRGFTYTHKPATPLNAAAIASANQAGFTINLSANTLAEADELFDLNIGPVVVLLPQSVHGNVKIRTPKGRTVPVCPATYRDDIACTDCKLCAIRDRECIPGFPAHSAAARKASAIASQ